MWKGVACRATSGSVSPGGGDGCVSMRKVNSMWEFLRNQTIGTLPIYGNMNETKVQQDLKLRYIR